MGPGVSLFVAAWALLHVLSCAAAEPPDGISDRLRQLLQRHGSSSQSLDGPHTLGCRQLQMFGMAPVSGRNTTVLLSLWVRRVGRQAGPFALPHQERDVIRGFLIVEDLGSWELTDANAAHLTMPVDLRLWQPSLLLQLTHAAGASASEPPASLPVVVNREHLADGRFSQSFRPVSFHVELPEGAGNCFKLLETNFPLQRVPFCLHPHPDLCPALAPPGRHTPSSPALWSVFGPFRDYGVPTKSWQQELAAKTAAQLHHYMSYHLAVGLSGLLLYADQAMRSYLGSDPLVAPYLHSGTLRFVHWELPERQAEGNPAYNGYNYDQALVASHALLGLSACGTSLTVLITDVDEYLHFPGGGAWPQPLRGCMAAVVPPAPQPPAAAAAVNTSAGGGGGAAQPAAIYTVRRRSLMSTTVPVSKQPALWVRPPPAVSAASVPPLAAHPLSAYDLISKASLPPYWGKNIVTPAFGVIAFYVHEGFALRGEVRLPDEGCAVLLHVFNMFKVRASDEYDRNAYEPFQLPVLARYL